MTESFTILEQERRESGLYYVLAEIECRCGKIYQYSKTHPREDFLLKLIEVHSKSVCAACAADLARDSDSCPEVVTVPGGVSSCFRPYHHEGRCSPMNFLDIAESYRDALEMLDERGNDENS